MSSSNIINSFGNVNIVKCTPTFMWTINNFCVCHKKTSDVIKSPIFSMGTNDEIKWRIHLYPKGFDKSYSNYVSLFLQLESCNQNSINIKYKFYILNNKKTKAHEIRCDTERLFTSGCDWGFREFVTRDFLFDKKNGLLPDNKLTLYCEIDVIKYNNNAGENIAVPLKLSSDQSKVINDLEFLVNNRRFADVTFVVNDKKFFAHKAILAARSPAFLEIFENQMQDNKHASVIEISDVDETIIKELLRYIYVGKVENIQNIAQDLLRTAHKFGLEALQSLCEDALKKNLNIHNAADILALADYYKAQKLKKDTIHFIVTNEDVTSSQEFKTMIASQPHLITEVFKTVITSHNGFNIPHKKRKSSDTCTKED